MSQRQRLLAGLVAVFSIGLLLLLASALSQMVFEGGSALPSSWSLRRRPPPEIRELPSLLYRVAGVLLWGGLLLATLYALTQRDFYRQIAQFWLAGIFVLLLLLFVM